MFKSDLFISLGVMLLLLIITLTPFLVVSVVPASAESATEGSYQPLNKDQRFNYAVAIFPPRTSFVSTLNKINAAQGVMVKDGRYGFVTYSASSRSDYASALYKQGALFVLKADLIKACYAIKA